MDIEQSIDVLAAPERVWNVMIDVEHWPEWTASVRSIEILGGERLEIGSRARVRQPRLPAAVYAVTVLERGRYFEWQSVAAGVRTVAGHGLLPLGDGRTRVTLTVDWSGALAPLARLAFGGLTRRYVETEAGGLKRQCEAS